MFHDTIKSRQLPLQRHPQRFARRELREPAASRLDPSTSTSTLSVPTSLLLSATSGRRPPTFGRRGGDARCDAWTGKSRSVDWSIQAFMICIYTLE